MSGSGDGFRPFKFVTAIVDAAAKGEIEPLSVHAVSLVWAIARHAHNGSGHCKLGAKRACGLSGISGKTQLRRARDELAGRGFIRFTAGTGHRASDYWLLYAAIEGYQGGTPTTEAPRGRQAGTAGRPDGHPRGAAVGPRTTAGTSSLSPFPHSGARGREEDQQESKPGPPPRPRRRDPRAQRVWTTELAAWLGAAELPPHLRDESDLIGAVKWAIDHEDASTHTEVLAFLERWHAQRPALEIA